MQCQPEHCLRRFHFSLDNKRNIHRKKSTEDPRTGPVNLKKSQALKLPVKSLENIKHVQKPCFFFLFFLPGNRSRLASCCVTSLRAHAGPERRLYFCETPSETVHRFALVYFIAALNTSPYGRAGAASSSLEKLTGSQQKGSLKKEKNLKLL